MIRSHSKIVGFLLVLPAIALLSSCYNTKNVAYFQDLNDTTGIYTQRMLDTIQTRIQTDDILSIVVNSINPQATAPFNTGNISPALPAVPQVVQSPYSGTTVNPNAMDNSNTLKGYLVDKNGDIDFPVIGTIHVAGLTTAVLRDTLKTRLNQYLQSPTVNVRIANYKVTVLGEVARPSTFSIPSERISVIDAIGMAGDLTIFGKRENVLVVREESGKREFVRLNLNSSDLFQSPYYYLKQNDIVYVEPNKSKVAASDITTARTISFVSVGLSLLIVLFSRL